MNAVGRVDRARRNLGTRLAGGDDQGRPLCARRWLHDGGRRRPDPGRRLRELLQGLWVAGASLLEAEVVTADGDVKVANACSNPDLFWALKGGGGGFGVVTRVTLRTHALREFLGRGVRDHQGVVRRVLPAPHLEDYRILRAGALQSALGPSSLSSPQAAFCRFRSCSKASTSNRPKRLGAREDHPRRPRCR